MTVSDAINAYVHFSENVFRAKRSAHDLFGRAQDVVQVRGKFDSEVLTQVMKDQTQKSGEPSEAKLLEPGNPKCKMYVPNMFR